MTTQNRCSTVQYSTVRTVWRRFVCRPFAASPHHTHALPASPYQTGWVLVTFRRRHFKDNSPAEEHGPPFAVSLHDTLALSARMNWTIHTKCICRQIIGGQPKKYRRYETKDIKIRERRRASRCVIMSSSSTNAVVSAAPRESA